MKTYIGTKTVKAELMTMGEACERKLLKAGVTPSECENDKAGYLVEYEGGYQSWSPADVFEAAYKSAETSLDRLRIEHGEVKARLERLERFLDQGFDEVAKKVGARQAALLVCQRMNMKGYVDTLEVRIADIEEHKDSK